MSESNTKYLVIGIIVIVVCCLLSIGGGVGWYFYVSTVTDTATQPSSTTGSPTNTDKSSASSTDKPTSASSTDKPTSASSTDKPSSTDKDVKPAETTKSTPQPIDCVMSDWSKCDKDCGGGIQTRTVTKEAANGGKACGEKTQKCNTDACPVIPAKVGEKCNPKCAEGAWCNSNDQMCYEVCVAKEKCTDGNAVPRKGTYFCDYSGCTQTQKQGKCQWLSNTNYTWVDMPQITDQSACTALNKCSSGGACYQWV